MWSCDRSDSKNFGPIVHVLNGFYPEADVGCMSLNSLEKLVAALVRCTTDRTDRPKWWPSTITYDPKINLGLEDERDIKLALKQLIVNCSQFFNKEQDGNGNKWSVSWNDEKRRKKRSRHHPRPRLPIPFVRLERPSSPGSPSKHEFLHYFRLNPKCRKIDHRNIVPPPGCTVKLTNCVQIPFSSNVGQLMASKEQHRMSEDLKMKRLEKSEWYTNKESAKIAAEVEYEVLHTAKEAHDRSYKMPRRQFHQRRPGLHDAEFLAKFCTPVYVNLHRLNLDKPTRCDGGGREGKQLMVIIDKDEKMCCDAKTTKIVRTSSRLQNV